MERNRLARQIIDTCTEMTRTGLNQGTAGNVSVRYQGGMLITPTGIPYEKLTEDKIVFIDAEGQHEQGKLPSSEWRFHQAAYQTRPDARAVVHNHAVHCTAVSILNRPIPAIHYMIAAAGGNSIPCAPYATFGTRELSEHVAVALKHRKATLLQHHGLIACEASPRKRSGWRMKWRSRPSSTSVRWRLPTRSRCWMTRRSPSCWRSSKPTDYALKSDAATLTGEPRWQTE